MIDETDPLICSCVLDNRRAANVQTFRWSGWLVMQFHIKYVGYRFQELELHAIVKVSVAILSYKWWEIYCRNSNQIFGE